MRLFLLQQKIIIYQKRQMEKNVRKGEIKSNMCNRINAEEIEVPSRVDGKRRNLARVSDFVSSRVPRHKITHECKIPPLSIHE